MKPGGRGGQPSAPPLRMSILWANSWITTLAGWPPGAWGVGWGPRPAATGRPPRTARAALARGAAAQEAGGRGRAAVGTAVAHVDLVGEFVDHHIGGLAAVAMVAGMRPAACANGLPAQHDGAAMHGLAHDHFVVVVDDEVIMEIGRAHV